jgi:HK97 family phage prohead protease
VAGQRQDLPVHWNHSGAAADIIGAIDPAAMRELPDEGLYVEGKLDLQDSEVAREAWRSMKNNAVSLSFGYLATRTPKRKDGIQDLLEITVAPEPANPETRFLSLKAVTERRVPSDAELRQQAKALGLEPPLTRSQLRRRSDEIALEHALGWQPAPKVTPEPAKSVPTAAQQRRRPRRPGGGLAADREARSAKRRLGRRSALAPAAATVVDGPMTGAPGVCAGVARTPCGEGSEL